MLGRLLTLAALVASLLQSCAGRTPDRTLWMPVDAVTGDVPVFALWGTSNNSGRIKDAPGVIVAAWDNGRVVFSNDRMRGGPPFSEKRMDPSTIVGIHRRAWNAVDPLELRGFAFPDAAHTTLFVNGQERCQVLASALELNPRSASWTTSSLDPDFAAFCAGWNEATDAVRCPIDASAPTTSRDPTRFENVAIAPVR